MLTPVKKHTAVRIDEQLHEQLVKAAQDEGRSVNQQIVFYIRQGLATSERQQKGA